MQAHIGGVSVSLMKGSKDMALMVYFSGCNFKCPYCNSKDLVDFRQEHIVDLREIKRIIRRNKSADFVLFTGGEPTLQKQALLNLAKYSKQNKLKVGLETNGTKPDAVLEMIKKGFVDYIALDIKSPLDGTLERLTKSKTFFKTTASVISDIRETIGILKEKTLDVDIEIVTTIIPSLMYRKEDMEAIAAEIKDIGCVWVLNQFIPSEFVLNKLYSTVTPPTEDFLVNLRTHVMKRFPRMRIEVRLKGELKQDFQELKQPFA